VALNTNKYTTIAVAGALLVLAGFTVVRFLFNFDQMQRLEEEDPGSGPVGVLPDSEGSRSRAPGSATESVTVQSAEVEEWLAPLNRYRTMVGLAPVVADLRLSHGDVLHSHYLTLNYAAQTRSLRLGAEAHTEDPANPAFTAEGAASARASDIDWLWDPGGRPGSSWAIDDWINGPFHRMQVINPYLRKVGYGADCQGAVCFAALDTGAGVEHVSAEAAPWPTPLFFPPHGSVINSSTFTGEWPDPLTSCSGYTPPAGLPITLELGGGSTIPLVSDYSLKRVDHDPRMIEACAFDASSYVNPEPSAQSTARDILSQFGAIVIVPRTPLEPGRYIVEINAGKNYRWSFSIAHRDSAKG
jgi:hypothetical protein